MADPLIDMRGVTLTRDRQRILDHVDMTVAPGEIVTLIGQNGAGKSTLVKIALGLVQPDQGTVRRKAALRIGYQPQRLSMDSALPLTVRRFLTLTYSAPIDALTRVLATVGMDGFLEDSVHTLSGGELQRVMLARAMLR